MTAKGVMCDFHSVTRRQAEIVIELTSAKHDRTGNLLPGRGVA
jgi:hypothetical protein